MYICNGNRSGSNIIIIINICHQIYCYYYYCFFLNNTGLLNIKLIIKIKIGSHEAFKYLLLGHSALTNLASLVTDVARS